MTTVPLIERLATEFDSTSFRTFVNQKFSGNFAPVQLPVPVDLDAPWAQLEEIGTVEESSPDLLPSLRGWERLEYQARMNLSAKRATWAYYIHKQSGVVYHRSYEIREPVEVRISPEDRTYYLVRLPVRASTVPATARVTDPVGQILALPRDGERSPKALRLQLGLPHRETFRENYLHPAIDAGLIEVTLPDKPTSRNQKYRLTERGRAVLRSP
jgi:hypothetical protein